MVQIDHLPNNEVIDNEKEINDKLSQKEDLVALGVLKYIDAQVVDYDIDLAVDRVTNKFRFIVDGKDVLNIPLNIDQVIDMGTFLIELLNKIDQVEFETDLIDDTHIEAQVDEDGFLGSIGMDKDIFSTETLKEMFGTRNNANYQIQKIKVFLNHIKNKKRS